jgi:hypothetical protein
VRPSDETSADDNANTGDGNRSEGDTETDGTREARGIRRRSLLRSAGAGTAGAALGLGASSGAASAGSAGGAGPRPLAFGEQTYVDTDRAGGEPTVEMHPDGTLLYGGHAGSSHVYAPAAGDEDSSAYVENYEGQAYYWWSDDLGETWTFADRTLPPEGVPGSGFSDPEFAVDTAGQVYISEINLANVAVSKSTDAGRSYELQNLFGQDIEDRQWMAADEKDVLYMTGNVFGGGTVPNDPVGNFGHTLFKSTDGGETFASGVDDPDGLGDIHVDKETGTLYETFFREGELGMVAFRGARADDFEREEHTIAAGVDLRAAWPAFDLDPEGNLYATWDEGGNGDRLGGIYYAASTDGGRTWSAPVRVDTNENTDIWPWIAVGSRGRAAIAWIEASKKLPNNDSETPGDHTWRVVAAGTLDGLSADPTFSTGVATPDPIHQGTICNGGTICQAEGVDRRLGDFFTIEIDNTGRVWIGYPDTRMGGAIALPGFVRQEGGPRFIAGAGRSEQAVDVTDNGRPATDPDGDGRFEDVNGDGDVDTVDVQALFAHRDDEAVRNNAEAFDFNRDGAADVVDVQALFREVS